ncbi:uncharacterized protein MONBRDRAFT_12720 [Monosiga brevicollis MX1]|uniref:Uncharacterized protein n=1 Tax=Monosiga brevicollis TaxID=81824 RepID=A9VD45_MONBE|nr:uncharacterized protein MONBRDRAFT_12720 [Monosiga brevicollis MX1]EDQ84577.1 predicted protein [Monosiga brevicollis MX1]|eukprot:XP_001750604.1 hypothetical protein [Monosiga brevicollis MX1]
MVGSKPVHLPLRPVRLILWIGLAVAVSILGAVCARPSAVLQTAAAPGSMVFPGDIGCNLSQVPPGVVQVQGSVNLNWCQTLTSADIDILRTVEVIDGGLFIYANPALEQIDGLNSLIYALGRFQISGGAYLVGSCRDARTCGTVRHCERYRMLVVLCLHQSDKGRADWQLHLSVLGVSSSVIFTINQRGNGWTPLHWACYNGHVKASEMLLNHGADAKAKAWAGHAPLHWACIEGHVEVVEMLLKHGVDTEAKDNDGDTSLHLACGNDHVKVVEVLLKHGADAEAKDNRSETPLDVARQHKHDNKLKSVLTAHEAGLAVGPQTS